MASLDDYRNEIDNIDKDLTKLFEKRMDVVLKVAEYKKNNSVGVFHKGREEEVIKKAIDTLKNKDYSDELTRFLNSTMEISRGLQKRKIEGIKKLVDLELKKAEINKHSKIGFPGVKGAFTEEALLKFFGEENERIAYEDFEDVFIALQNDEVEYGVLPIENSSTGAISDTYDLLRKYGFYVVGEEEIRIEQHLVGIKGSIVEEIDEIYSHPQGIEQSSEFLKRYHHWKLIPFHNTATSAKLIKDLADKRKAAIASKRAADIYGLEVIKSCVNNQKDNNTRFVVIGKELLVCNECNKVSVVFSLEDEAGTLFRLLRHFAENNINMIKIESRPMKDTSWKYFLYVDFEGSIANEEVLNALRLIEKNSAYFKLLGAYKKRI